MPDFLRNALQASRSVFVLTGAGISAPSGIPTYRGSGGLYPDGPPTWSHAAERERDPDQVEAHFQRRRQAISACRPNGAHLALAKLEKERRVERFLLATQNVDGLHGLAGSENMARIHGNLWEWCSPHRVHEQEHAEMLVSGGHRHLGFSKLEYLVMIGNSDSRACASARQRKASPDGWHTNVTLIGDSYENRMLAVDHFVQGGVDLLLVVGCSTGVGIPQRMSKACRGVGRTVVVEVNPEPQAELDADHRIPMCAVLALTLIWPD